jgi:hypothetical protein
MSAMKSIRNERGILTLDFIFAMMLGMSFTMVFFALTLTLSLVEVTQYISFSVARAALGAQETRTLQVALGNRKYDELRNRPIFKAIFGRGWFRLPAQPNYGSPTDGFNTEYNVDPNQDNATFYGARIRIEARILDITIPMLGSSKTDPETGFANVQTFLGREVTTQECRENFNRARWNAIQALHSSYAGARNPTPFLITDNGC